MRALDETSHSEQQRLKNIEENERLLKELGLAQGGSAVLGIPSGQRETSAARRNRAQQTTKRERVQPVRTSARIRGVKLEEDGPRSTSEPTLSMASPVHRRARHGDLDLDELIGDDFDDKSRAELQRVLNVRAEKSVSEASASELESLLHTMTLRSYARVAQKRIYSMVFHPTQDKDLIFTGDQSGTLSIWEPLAEPSFDAAGDDGDAHDAKGLAGGTTFSLQPHGQHAIGCLRIDPLNIQRLYSSSHDGTLRMFDLAALTSTEVWGGVEGMQLSEFELLPAVSHAGAASSIQNPAVGAQSLWLSDHRGGLSHIDLRSKPSTTRRWQVSEKKIGGLSLNPRALHCVAAASNDRTVSLFDVRALDTVSTFDLAPPKLDDVELEKLQALKAVAQLDSKERTMACTAVDFSPNGDYLGASTTS